MGCVKLVHLDYFRSNCENNDLQIFKPYMYNLVNHLLDIGINFIGFKKNDQLHGHNKCQSRSTNRYVYLFQ